MTEYSENLLTCPQCGYRMLFPPAETVWNCPVCGEKVKKERGLNENY